MNTEEHYAEIDRLWNAVKRDFFTCVETVAGARVQTEEQRADGMKRLRRITLNWEKLAATDVEIAASLFHSFDQIVSTFAMHGTPNSPADQQLRNLDEVIEMVRIGRQANPNADVETIGGLYALGVEANRDQIDAELDDLLGHGETD